MRRLSEISRCSLAAVLLFCAMFSFTYAQSEEFVARLDVLFEELADPDKDNWQANEREIWRLWSQSGSDAMDLLLIRGKRAMSEGDLIKAVEHFTALIDHAPEFSEGWNARATAFFAMEEYGPSVSDIRQTLALNPRHFGALSGLGGIFETLEEPENALRAYRAALALHPRLEGAKEAVERLEELTAGTSL